MLEAIQIAAMEAPGMVSAANAAKGQTAQSGGQVASGSSINQFGQAMSTAASNGVQAPQQVQAGAQVDGTQSVASLEGSAPAADTGVSKVMSDMFTRLDGGAKHINEISNSMATNAADLKPGEILQMTMACHQFLFQTELTSNVANRSSDGVQQLFRQQS